MSKFIKLFESLSFNPDKCVNCKICERVCPFGAIIVVDKKAQVQDNCSFCGACVSNCSEHALSIDRPTASKEELAKYKGVFVFAELEASGDKIKRVSYELLAKGRELADKLKQELVAVILGQNIKELSNTLVYYGADKVFVCDHELLENYATDSYTNVISAVVAQEQPSILLLGATINGRDLGPRIAARLKLGLTADCTGLDIDEEDQLVQTRPAFGGNIMASIVSPYTRPQMATVRPNTFPALTPDETRKGDIIDFEVKLQKRAIRTKVVQVAECADDGNICIEEANIIVSAGRGIQSKENLDIAEELAKELGGVLGTSRALVDLGWTPHTIQVGQSGTTVCPKLYIALGISGAIQHIVGMSSSDIIVAINNDPEAPIFKIADFGIVGDIFEVVPKLIRKIKEFNTN